MAKGNFVYSTSSNSSAYILFEHAEDMPIEKQRVTIYGGANVPNKQLVTPRGVVTEVSDEELDFLMKNDGFLQHMKAGFITVEKRKVDVDKVVANMEPKDKSAPLTSKDFAKSKVKPKED